MTAPPPPSPPPPPARPPAPPTFARPVSGRDAAVVVILALAGVAAGAVALAGLLLRRGPAAAPWGLGVLGAAMLAGVALGLRARGIGARDLGLVAPARPLRLLWQIPVAWLAPVAAGGAAAAALSGGAAPETNTAAVTGAAADPAALAAALAVAVVLAPLAEEILFRRILLGWIEGRWGRAAAVAGTAAAFGAVHGIPAVMVVMACLGVALALLTVAQRSIVPSLVVHALNNAAAAGAALAVAG